MCEPRARRTERPVSQYTVDDKHVRSLDAQARSDNYVRGGHQLYARDPATRPVEGFVHFAPYQAVVAQALDLLANQVCTKLAK